MLSRMMIFTTMMIILHSIVQRSVVVSSFASTATTTSFGVGVGGGSIYMNSRNFVVSRLSLSTTEAGETPPSATMTDGADSSSTTTTTNVVVPWTRPDRVILPELPTVYVYDHCPFCVRVRFALGLKNIKHSINFLANDDKQTPTKLVGKKISPIFQHNDIIMPESMDIIKYIDSNVLYGPVNVFVPSSDRTDINAWQTSVRDLLRGLQRPRYVATGLLPEFQQLESRNAFIMNHPIGEYTKEEWKALSIQEQLPIYAEMMSKDPASDVEELNRKLIELDDILYSEYHCSPTNGISYDDIDLFSRLRSITIIRDVDWPIKLRTYMDRMSEISDVPLYDEMAM